MKMYLCIAILSAGLAGLAVAQDIVPDEFAPPEDMPEDPVFKAKEKSILKKATASPTRAQEAKKKAVPKPAATNAPAAEPKPAAANAPAAEVKPAAPALAPAPAEGAAAAPAPAAEAAVPAATNAPPPPPLNLPALEKVPTLQSRQYFGVNLGEDLQGVLDRAKTAGAEARETGVHYDADLHEYAEHTIDGSLDGNKTISSVLINSYKGRVCTVRAYFNDNRETFINSLNKGLAQKYGVAREETKDVYPECKETHYDYDTQVEGQKVQVQLAVFRNPQTAAILRIYVKYTYEVVMQIHDEMIRQTRAGKP